MSIEQNLKIVQTENISTLMIYIECDKIHRWKVCVQEFWYFVSGLDIQLEQSKDNCPVPTKNQLQVAIYNESYTVFSVNQYKSMA